MNLLTLTPAEFCAATNACEEWREFAVRHTTMADVWDNCPRLYWLIWIAYKVDQVPDDRTLRLFAVWCARHAPIGDGRVTGDLLTDPRSLAALEVAERYAHGKATAEELAAVYRSAAAAVLAARHARATRSIRDSLDAVADAAFANAYDAAIFAASRNPAARNGDCRAQADQFRRMVANPFRP